MSISFCIITGGKRPDTIRTVIKSIKAQGIPTYEIIVVGNYHSEPDSIYIEAEEAAVSGRLGEMRNKAVSLARHENIVILDDDIILSLDWYSAFLSFSKPFDILTSQVRVPDGGRYWDHATVGGPKGHIILAEDEDDDYVYMTGGGGWIMKDYVARNVKWDPHRAFYQEEDIDFSRKCQAEGFKITHNHRMLVFHADPTYTCIGRVTARRKEGRSQEWILSAFDDLTLFQILQVIRDLRGKGHYAEAADYVRMGVLKGPFRWLFRMMWRKIVHKLGGELPGTNWFPMGDPAYLKALEKYGNIWEKGALS